MMESMQERERWSTLDQILSRSSPFGNETGQLPNGYYLPSEQKLFQAMQAEKKVLVVGAGGLGCEILKDLALSGIKNIHVIDLDTIDISNLNRQFLFRMKDVGRTKAEVAAEFIMKRVPGCLVTPYVGKIQDHGEDYYSSFDIIVAGLDNIDARRWLNSMLLSIVKYDQDGDPTPESIIPMLDGGTEGLKGQARVIIPTFTSCFECSLDSFPPHQGFAMCTIAETPRLPEHCIAYVYILEWDRHFPDLKLDKDSPADMKWVFERALERANKFGIEGVTYFKTMGVVKNIIPAVASTNAIISAVCANEAIKLLTYGSQTLNTYYMYMGQEGLYSSTFEYGKKEDCIVCSGKPLTLAIPSTTTVRTLITLLKEDHQLKNPSIMGDDVNLYMPNPPAMEEALSPNLDRPLSELVDSGETLYVTDPALSHLRLRVTWQL